MSSESISSPLKNPARSALSAVKFGICLFIALLVLVPLATAVLGGFKNSADLQTSPFGWPDPFQVTNYQEIITGQSFWQELGNSTMVMLATAFGVVVLASMPAFVFSRLRFRGRDALFNFFTLGLLFPITVAILPLYITLRQANLVDSLWGIILPQIAFGLPGNILILRGFFAAVPFELEEAAILDGCSYFGFFWRVLLPLVRPALAAVIVLTMVASWNNFFLPLLVLNSEKMYTLPLGIMQYQGQYGADWARVLAFISLALIPTIAFYLVAERHIVSGLTAGAVKG
ncbi:MAG TPA: carbohydrate ABC transporter permease [Chloroflexia bacterium]|nr:carbohydrate ABC transporter permease [Chloroflexia bacterium]